MRSSLFPLAALLVAAVVSSTAVAGVYLESTRSGADKATAKVSKLWFDGGRMRSEGSAPGTVAIFKNRTMYTLDAGSKSYRVMDQASIDQLGDRMAGMRKQMEAKMAGMPPEQRQKLEKMLGQMGGGGAPAAAKRTLRNTGRTESAAGVTCTVWEASVDGQKEEEICAAKAATIPGGDEVMATLKEIGVMLKGFTQSVGKVARNGASQPWLDMETINGVPIVHREFENGKVASETRLTTARKESVPGAQFEVPAGYTEKKAGFGPGAKP
jgi:hypothetical protein